MEPKTHQSQTLFCYWHTDKIGKAKLASSTLLSEGEAPFQQKARVVNTENLLIAHLCRTNQWPLPVAD